jgi:hypothetical protein
VLESKDMVAEVAEYAFTLFFKKDPQANDNPLDYVTATVHDVEYWQAMANKSD